HLRGLEVGGHRGWADGVEYVAGRADDRQRAEPAVGGRFGRVGDGLEYGPHAGDQAGPGAVDRTGNLCVAASEVAGHALVGDLDADFDREGAVAKAVGVGEVLSDEDAVRDPGQRLAAEPFAAVERDAHAGADRAGAVALAHLEQSPLRDL